MKPFEICEGIVVDKPLAEGATSIVYQAKCTKSLPFISKDKTLAVKLFRNEPTGKDKHRFYNELSVGKNITSAHLCKYFEHGIYETQLGAHPYILMEYIKGTSLSDTLLELKELPEIKIERIFLQIVIDILVGLKALHDNGIVHRDIQPKNIIISNEKAILLDYGSSKYLQTGSDTSVWEEIGTRRYWAPENLKPTKEKDETSNDIFMLASCLVHILSDKFIFSEAKNYPDFFTRLHEYYSSRSQLTIPELEDLPKWTSGLIKPMLTFMLDANPKKRPTIKELIALNKELLLLPSIRQSGYPISEFLWQLRNDEDILFLEALLEIKTKSPTGFLISVRKLYDLVNMPTYVFCTFISMLCNWGIMKQAQKGQSFFTRYPDEHSLHDNVEFIICDEIIEVVREIQNHPKYFEQIKNIKALFDNNLESNIRQFQYTDFLMISFRDELYKVENGDDSRLEFRLVVTQGLIEAKWLSTIELVKHETWGVYG